MKALGKALVTATCDEGSVALKIERRTRQTETINTGGGQVQDTFQQNYAAQRPWSDRFVPEMIQILVDVLGVLDTSIRISTTEEDIRDGVDVIIADGLGRDWHIGLRIRSQKHHQKYGGQFTVRIYRNRYGQNELDKIKAGKLHGMLYCFADPEDRRVAQWSLLRMLALRLAHEGDDRFKDVTCQSGSYAHCSFRAYDIDSFPPKSLVIASGTGTA